MAKTAIVQRPKDAPVDSPWQGLSTEVKGDLTPAELLKAAKLNWKVKKEPLFHYNDKKKPIQAKKIFGIIRQSDYEMLGACGPEYVPTQNSDALAFFDKFVHAGKLRMTQLGNIDDGRHIWALAETKKSFVLPGNDKVEAYMLLSQPHIWGKSLQIMFTPIRVVCQNTLAYALRVAGDDAFRFVHNQAFDGEVKKLAEKTLGISQDYFKAYEEQARFLAKKSISDAKLQKYVLELFQPKLLDKDAKNDNVDKEEFNRRVEKVLRNFTESPGADLSKGTWWSALNAVTYFTDHQAANSADARLKSAWFGPAASLKRRALDAAMIGAAA